MLRMALHSRGETVLFPIPEDLMCEGGKLWFRVLKPAN